ncbi:MAG: hypothetical protein M1453_07340 [Acidobacteria bacterium]|nr:hypothetical protein [Acidobacteriota bacterium]
MASVAGAALTRQHIGGQARRTPQKADTLVRPYEGKNEGQTARAQRAAPLQLTPVEAYEERSPFTSFRASKSGCATA